MEVSLPDLAQRVTVFGSTRNIAATSAGVSRASASCVRELIACPLGAGGVKRSCTRHDGAADGPPEWPVRAIFGLVPRAQPALSTAWSAFIRALTRAYAAAASSLRPPPSAASAAATSAAESSAVSASSSSRWTRPP